MEHNLFNKSGVNFNKLNNEFWKTYVEVANDKETSKKMEEMFLHLNYPMFLELVETINTRKHRIDATAEDAYQVIVTNYLVNLRYYRDDKGETSYPTGIYQKTLNDSRESISGDYTDGGIFTPYGTKKRKIKEGTYNSKRNDPTVYEKIVTGVDEYEILENGWFDKLQAYTASTEELVTSLDAPEMKSYIKESLKKALNMISEKEREIVSLRFFAQKNWTEIGEQYGMTEGGARFKCNEALKKLRTICIKEFELDACLA